MNHKLDLDKYKDSIKNKKVKKVVNVYQQTYINGSAEGFGDYLRGCISLSLLCSFLNLEFGMNIKNHKIHHFINTSNHIDNSIDYNNIKKVSIADKYSNIYDINEIILEINNTKDEICYLYTTLYFHYDTLSNYSNKSYLYQIIKNIIPNDNLNTLLNGCMKQYNLINKKYNIIHIRGGDEFLKNQTPNKDTIDTFITYIIQILKKKINRSSIYIIISDNSYCKSTLNKYFSNTIIMNEIDPVHLGIGDTNLNNVMGTMMDFYLMSNALQIISFSRYSHGSGFSKWASFLFNKPHIQYIFNDVSSHFINIIK